MVVLRIDGVEAPLQSESVKLPGYSARVCESVQPWRENRELKLDVVATSEMMVLFGHAEDMHRTEEFNCSSHVGEVVVDGVVVFEGEATLMGVERKGCELYYRVLLSTKGHDWAHNAAHTRLKNSDVEASVHMTQYGVEQTWEGDSAVRMLPLRYDSYPEPEDVGEYVTQSSVMPHEYHPFISVVDVVRSIARSAGYTLHSRFFDSDVAKRLMMSGAYRNVDTTLLQSTMGFKALRSSSTTSSAGDDGRVYVWEPIFASNIGVLVDTVTPNTLDEEGNPLSDAYSNGSCFRFEGARPVFTPKREVDVAFDMHLSYTTDYRIVSSKRLRGFTQLHLANNCDVEVVLQNPFKDMRSEVNSRLEYKLFIFDYDPKCSYVLDGFGSITANVTTVHFKSGYGQNTMLRVMRPGSGLYVEYDGDWALYEGYVEESGTRTVEVDVRTPYEKLTPSSPKRFNDIFFGGAIEGQQMTLHAGCSVTPVFGGSVGYGEELSFADVANVDISQAELLEAVAHLFNLRIYSHAPSKSLYIEPYDDFYGGGVVDWRDHQVGDGEVVTEQVVDGFERYILGYQPADGAAATYVNGGERELGTWDCHVENYAAKRSTKSLLNPLFHPTASFAGAHSSAPSAMVLTVGDRDMVADAVQLEPRVVLYHGIVSLPEGEYWPSPSERGAYPLAAFHSATMGATLDFDDRDGCEGLHRYYDVQLAEATTRQMLECDVHISPAEYAQLFDPHSAVTLRSHFRLEACGQSSLFRLERIKHYNTATHVACCIFARRMVD